MSLGMDIPPGIHSVLALIAKLCLLVFCFSKNSDACLTFEE